MGDATKKVVAEMVRITAALLLTLLAFNAQAKDYFGITLDGDTAKTVCQKADRVFADCDLTTEGDAIIQGNGLLRLLNPIIQQASVSFAKDGKAQVLTVLTRPLSDKSIEKLIKHLEEDYDLTGLSELSVGNLIDIRGHRWDIQSLCTMSKPCNFQVKITSLPK
jgi:hypothetical protein